MSMGDEGVGDGGGVSRRQPWPSGPTYQEALDLVEEFQRSGSSRGTTEITLVERQQKPQPTEVEVGSMRNPTTPWRSATKKHKFTC